MMTKIQSELQEHAKSRCLPYLLNLPKFAASIEQLSFIIVGSVATGLCEENSDVDIAIVCDEGTYETISYDTRWDSGRPSQTRIDGVQLHYYGITFEKIESRLSELDDVYLYVYNNTVILRDPQDRYVQWLHDISFHTPEIRKQRIQGKLDMLIRRSRGLGPVMSERDILCIGRLCLETITLCLKVIALLDDVPFDPRKRLFRTALKGRIGQQIEDRVRHMFSSIGNLGQLNEDSDFISFDFPGMMNEMINTLSEKAHKQGFQVGLEKLDGRHLEK